MAELTGDQLFRLLSSCRIRNFTATFEVVQPNGSVIPLSLTMPAGDLRYDAGREVPDQFVSQHELHSASWGRWVLRMDLLPEPSLQRGREALWRVIDPPPAPPQRPAPPVSGPNGLVR